MPRNLLTTAPALGMLLGFLSLGLPSRASADESADAVTAIERVGGSVKSSTEGWEVDFHLRGQGLTDADLAHVAALNEVVWLNLRNTKITNAGLVHLKGLEKLRWLHLEETVIGDEGIKHIAGLPNLEYLNLYATNVTDKSLEQLASSKRLARLYIWQTGVTDKGVARLEKSLPDLKIVRGLDLSKLPAEFPTEVAKPKPKLKLDWVVVSSRTDAPARSENGVNCTVWFENKSKQPIKLYWIGYGSGALQLYGVIDAGATREQNTYSRNAWLVTDEKNQPLGYFIVKEDDSHAVIPSQG